MLGDQPHDASTPRASTALRQEAPMDAWPVVLARTARAPSQMKAECATSIPSELIGTDAMALRVHDVIY